MLFHEDNPIPTKLSNKRLKMQSREQTPTTKLDAPKEVTFIDNEDQSLADEQFGIQPIPYVHKTSNHSEGGGYAGQGAMDGRGGHGGRGYSNGHKLILKNQVSLPHPWRNEIDNLLRKMRIDIMKEIKLAITNAISSQILEIAIAMATQIKTAITAEMSTAATDIMTLSHVELDEETELINQSSTTTNEETHSTPMEVDADPRKRKAPNDTEETTTTNMITPTRNLRPQKYR